MRHGDDVPSSRDLSSGCRDSLMAARAYFFAHDWTRRVKGMEDRGRLYRGDKVTDQVLRVGRLAWDRLWRIHGRASRRKP